MPETPSSLAALQGLVSTFGADVTARFATGAGEPEDHLRSPMEAVIQGAATAQGINPVVLAGEELLAEIRVKPDYCVFVSGAACGFIEVKAPGKGADPRLFTDAHDKKQWARLSALPNVLYTDGNQWALWRDGELQGRIWQCSGDVRTAGAALAAPDDGLLTILHDFLSWSPTPPTNARQLALTSARLCRLLRSEVEEIVANNTGMQALADDWRELLFPGADDARFSDEYSQTVTFALLLARVEGVDFADGDIGRIADRLGRRHGLIGTALDVLTNTHVLREVAVSVRTLVRVLSVVDWTRISRGKGDTWLLFYEDFLQEYDPALRKATGSYYTPAPVAKEMVRFADELLTRRFGRPHGLASDDVTIVDPASGTGTFLLQVLSRIAARIEGEQGPGAVGGQVSAALGRLVGFEIQAGPFAVAEMRLAAEARGLGAVPKADALRLYVTDSLEDPNLGVHHMAAIYEPIARSRRDANTVKRDENVMVVIGNPPYKEKSHGEGGWVEAPGADGTPPPLAAFVPPKDLNLGSHVKHLYNPYVYFWRWATWKVFENHPGDRGIVAFISASGFIAGPGFAQMRAYLRRQADAIWVIDLSPEGHQPPVSTRVFQGVQQRICIAIAVRDGSTDASTPAPVYCRAVKGHRTEKFEALAAMSLEDDGWRTAASDWTAPFVAAAQDSWLAMPELDDLMPWSGSGVMFGRTWVIAPDPATLRQRWARFVSSAPADRAQLLKEHPTDRRVDTVLSDNLPGYPPTSVALRDEVGACPTPKQFAYRPLDRQWLIPDKRVINRPNPTLWESASDHQLFLAEAKMPKAGPAVTVSALIPEIDHFRGTNGGRVRPLWRDASHTSPNVAPNLLRTIGGALGATPSPEDLVAYIVALAGSSEYSRVFSEDLRTPGLRIPITRDPDLFECVCELGRFVSWASTYGERFVDASAGRPSGAPLADRQHRPMVVTAISHAPADMPTDVTFDPNGALLIGTGRIEPVTQAMWDFEISGYRAIRHWVAYRVREPSGNKSSPLDDHVPSEWQATWTTELLELLNVLALLTSVEPEQARLLREVVGGPVITVADLEQAGVLPVAKASRAKPKPTDAPPPTLFP